MGSASRWIIFCAQSRCDGLAQLDCEDNIEKELRHSSGLGRGVKVTLPVKGSGQ